MCEQKHLVFQVEPNLRDVAADYRVRIFLSVDLSGSTAFKNSQKGEHRSEGETPRWVIEFQDFYARFPSTYKTNYCNLATNAGGNSRCPEVWKAIGDELVFCGRVDNIRALCSMINAFIQTLHDYRKILQDRELPLNVKGAAWLAAFPEPNRTVYLRTDKAQDFFYAAEAIERAADAAPHDFDFLGKAIDTGFRVASTATPEKFAICAQLGTLLSSASDGVGNGYIIHFEEPVTLKGVNMGNTYPVLYLDTMKHMPLEDVRRRERVLLGKKAPEPRDLSDYLQAYCAMVGTDQIVLPKEATSETPTPPATYLKHRSMIENTLKKEMERESASGTSDGSILGGNTSMDESDSLKPLE